MRTFSVRKSAALGGAAVLAVSLGVATTSAQGSEYPQNNGPVLTNPANYTPNLVQVPGGRKPVAYTVAEGTTDMVVGGDFDQVSNNTGGDLTNQSNVFAFDKATGVIDHNFAPVVDGDVWSTLVVGNSVYIGGGFKNINGQPRAALAKLNLSDGSLDTSFQPTFKGGRVSDMALSHGQLIVSGTIQPRLKSLNPATGKPTTYVTSAITGRLPNSNSAQVFKFSVSPDQTRLVAVGNFLQVDGLDRPRMFMMNLDDTSATLSSWNYPPNGIPCSSGRTNAQSYIQDVDFSPDSSWFAVAAFGFQFQQNWGGQNYFGRQLCDSVSRFETDNLAPQRPTWINYTGGDSLKSVGVTNTAVYVQGHSRWLDNPVVTNGVTNPKNGNPGPGQYPFDRCGTGCVSQPGGGAVDPNTGVAIWNPVMPQQSGGYQILPTATGVWFATDGERFGHEYRRGIRFAPLP
jgi:hypothetical protein